MVKVKCPTHGIDTLHCRHGLGHLLCDDDCTSICYDWAVELDKAAIARDRAKINGTA